jgi:peptide/nickel transport system permease protein
MGATIIIFAASRVLGDPTVLFLPEEGYGLDAAELDKARKRLHLDKPVPLQYAFWVADILRGDLGQDLGDRHPISTKLKDKLPPTLRLAVAAYIISTLIGIPLGVLSAVKRGSIWDLVGRTFALLGQALPIFWVGILGILIFAVWLQLLPAGTQGEGFSIKHYILPTLTLAWFPAAGYMRLMRSAMLDVMDSEYVKLARAKGVGANSIIWKHAFKNALIPPLTFSALLLAGLLNGAVVAEVVFAWPGLGRIALVQAVNNNDFPLLTGAVLVFIVIYLFMNFVADLLYAWIDPRIRYS